MTEYEKGYRDAKIKIIQNMYDVEGEWLLRECDRLEKEIGLPAKEIGTIIFDYDHQLNLREFEQIVAESDSKEEAVYRLAVISQFNWDFIMKNLGVTDDFIIYCLGDQAIRQKYARIIYAKLKNKPEKSSHEKEFFEYFAENVGEGKKQSSVSLVCDLYRIGKSTDSIKSILKAWNINDEEVDNIIKIAKSLFDDKNTAENK